MDWAKSRRNGVEIRSSGKNNRLFSLRHGPDRKRTANNSSVVARNLCIGNMFTEPLPSNEVKDLLYQEFTYERYVGHTRRHRD